MTTTLKAYDFFQGEGRQFLRLQGAVFKQYINEGMPETTNSVLRVGEGSSMLGIRVGVPHDLTWEGFDIGGGSNFDFGGLR